MRRGQAPGRGSAACLLGCSGCSRPGQRGDPVPGQNALLKLQPPGPGPFLLSHCLVRKAQLNHLLAVIVFAQPRPKPFDLKAPITNLTGMSSAICPQTMIHQPLQTGLC